MTPLPISILIAILVFAILVIVHEFGHFIVAKRSGVRVDEFAIGFPPRIWSVKRGETRYSINALPLGGYVLMPGENGQMYDEKGNVDPRTFAAQPASKRAAILVAGVTMNLILAWVVYMGWFGVYGVPRDAEKTPAVVSIIENNSPASLALKVGDKILSVNGRSVNNEQDAQDAIQSDVFNAPQQLQQPCTIFGKKQTCVPITLVVLRNAAQQTLHINARVIPPQERQSEGPIGFGFPVIYDHVSLFQLPGAALNQIFVGNFKDIAEGFHKILIGIIQPQNAFAGPVGIVNGISQAASSSDTIGQLLQFIFNIMAFLSWNLAVFNLLPIPGLDGGRLLLVGVEVLRRGRRLAPEREALINLVGLGFLLSLILVFTVNDIINIVH
jgi:regulator of sigma E protease